MQLRLLESDATDVAATRKWIGATQPDACAVSRRESADQLRFWRPLPRREIDLVCASGAVYEMPFHAHEAIQVLLPASPLVIMDAKRCVTTVYPGQVHVTRPLELCAARSVDHMRVNVRVMLLSPTVIERLREVGAVNERESSPEPSHWVVDDAALHAELATLFDALRGPLVALGCESPLLACIARLFDPNTMRRRFAAGPELGIAHGVTGVRDHLRAHPADGVTLDDLASVARLDKFQLLRAFRRAYGLTPHEYHMQLRLARARRLLAEGRPLSHVTYDAGFADQSHLTRRFKTFFDLTPARYARQVATSLSSGSRTTADVYRAAVPVPA
jgi:AraC-like DNA-binding protein